jgi:predicted phage baseplate assembly protein
MADEVWWERSAGPDRRGTLVSGPGPTGREPELVVATRERVRADVSARVPAYTPDWTNPDPADAGVALVRLFGNLTEPVLTRLNRLPEKLLADELNVAGVSPLPATPSDAFVQFTVVRADGTSVLVPEGFQISAPPATGPGDQIIFETQQDLYATPATIGSVAVADSGRLEPVTGATTGQASFAAFGTRPQPGNALWLGLSGVTNPYPSLSLGIILDPGGAPVAPAGAGGSQPPSPTAPLLRWDVLDGTKFVAAQVSRDGTGGLRTSGVVELRLPRSWAPGAPTGPRALPTLRWLRVMVAHGDFPAPPTIAGLYPNLVPATAVRTVRDEVPQPVQGDPNSAQTRMRLSQVPIVPGSVVLDVQDVADTGVFGTVAAPVTAWREVPSLADRGPTDRVFTVDYATGLLTFGDGVHGAKVPLGFRNVTAQRYRVGGGANSAVPARAISSMVSSLPFVTGVTNPLPAQGGTDAEPTSDVMRDGPAQLRAGGRAVAPDDYGLLAREAPGVRVARAHGVPGTDPARPGLPVPGVVGVLVVPAVPDSDHPPVPDEATLTAVAEFLAGSVAPVGVRVVAGAPRYQRVAVEAWVVLDPTRERADLLTQAAGSLYEYLHPVRGGADGAGWPFGGPLRYVPLVRRLLSVPGVRAVPRLRLTLDGLDVPPCTDQPLRPDALPWPSRPVLIPVDASTVVTGGPS